jgi:kumamolisin
LRPSALSDGVTVRMMVVAGELMCIRTPVKCGWGFYIPQNPAAGGESVWNDGEQGGASGGGVSGFFTLPAWQDGLQLTLTSGVTQALTMRGVPDVSGDADPDTGYDVRIDGTDTVIGGTSAVAPLWAGLIARINSTRGTPVGLINPQLYATASVLNDITTGNNGSYEAGQGWDACTGLGSPDGTKIAALFAQNTTSPAKSAAA